MTALSALLSAMLLSIVSSAALADSASSVSSSLYNTSLLNTSPAISLPNVSPANSDLANRGAYVARTADCMACHREDYSGGVAIETPIGNIYSTNISPSKLYGIGNYTEADLKKRYKKAVRLTISFIQLCPIRPIMV